MSPEDGRKIGLWPNRPATVSEVRIVAEIEAERARVSKLLHTDSNGNSREVAEATAFCFDLTYEGLLAEGEDYPRFKAIFRIATEQPLRILNWEDATVIYEGRRARQEKLMHRIAAASNRRNPDYPKPCKIYEAIHKPRKGKTRAQVSQRWDNYFKSKEISDAFAIEEGTPIDEFPEMIEIG
jgi:hypothetical protein